MDGVGEEGVGVEIKIIYNFHTLLMEVALEVQEARVEIEIHITARIQEAVEVERIQLGGVF
jgi:hypothetical protein